jgi:2-haloacid dehalogenase
VSGPTIVVFDLGGVLIDWDPRHLYRKMFDDANAMERFLADICNADWISQLDGGLPMSKGVAMHSARHPDMANFIEAYWKRWPEMITGAINGSVEILQTLKARDVPLYALSNWSVETWPYARDQFAFLDLFDGLVISGFEGTKKPDKEIFEILIDRHSIMPADALFIDDRLENTDAAKQLGFHGIQFTGPDALSRKLEHYGFL